MLMRSNPPGHVPQDHHHLEAEDSVSVTSILLKVTIKDNQLLEDNTGQVWLHQTAQIQAQKGLVFLANGIEPQPYLFPVLVNSSM